MRYQQGGEAAVTSQALDRRIECRTPHPRVYRGRNASRVPPLPGVGGRPGSSRWRQRAPRTPFRQRIVGWRARNWRRVVLAWFVLSMIIVVVAAEPKTDFPKAQARSVPAVQMFLRVAGGADRGRRPARAHRPALTQP